MSAPIVPKYINSQHAPAAIGPYVHAIAANGMLYCSGQIGLDAGTGEMVEGGIEAQTRKAMENLLNICAAGMCRTQHIVKCTIYVKDLNDFAAVNKVYEEMLGNHRPARATVEVARLPKDALVEIDCIAVIPEPLKP